LARKINHFKSPAALKINNIPAEDRHKGTHERLKFVEGKVGLVAMRIARLLGAARIIVVDRAVHAFRRRTNWAPMRRSILKNKIRSQKSEISRHD
jgi:hypothetical protein